ncbi:flagellar biosynthetic protein FliO, partial [Methylobacterium sp. J-026]|uniref:flagellar biosynthetic protein FliO n=1 Tax=Methylobacterium sp. J-026 TaxID=2836624 RepID=UPI001FB95CD4
MFGSDGSPIVQYVVIFAVIFTALAAIVFTVRRLTGRSVALPGRGGGRGRQPRLGIVDVYELDRARQLILLRRDNVEHLLLVGGPNDVVVERNIQRAQRPLPEASLRGDAGTESLDEPLPDPLVQGGRLPEPPRALPETAGRRAEPLFDPGFEMPVIVPPPVPRSAAGPSLTLPLDPALLGGDEPGQDVSAPLSPAPPVAAPPAAPVREPAAPRRILSRTAPPLVDPRPAPVPERPPEAVPAAEPTARPAPSLAVPSDRRTVDPAVLSDMARQLQAALSRPTSAVTPAPPAAPLPAAPSPLAPPPLAPPQPAPPAPPDPVHPLAAAMASAPPVPPAEPGPTVPPPAPPALPSAAPPAQPQPQPPAPAS